ncbi:envelope glycoprotein B [macacine betaherpesvirus 9]|uniref:Envelope glycoprotein B n=1 Tax=macacine betaherpesvirus 9 TaxID=2560568 RepID=A0A192XNM6_9BETA|nr:envelope glycoprotein B [macacine betaherpesvirus 9]ANC96526.1 envelope glycoprotein B [macacine betaherpesvirus 9]
MKTIFLNAFLISLYIEIFAEPDFVYTGHNKQLPFRICSIATGTDLVRFDRDFSCAPYGSNIKTTEGILVIYKTKIEAHTFPVRTFKKELTFQTTYRDIGVVYFLDRTITTVPMPIEEVHMVNSEGSCLSSTSLKHTDGYEFVAYHKDEYINSTLDLIPLNFKSSMNRRYITTKEPFIRNGPLWFYSTSTSINCIVTDCTAKTKFPFNFFALSTGETVEGSPFYDGQNAKVFNEPLEKVQFKINYTMLEDFDNGANGNFKTVPKIAFLEKSNTIFSWEVQNEDTTICLLKHWITVPHALRAENSKTFHFIAQELTSTFVTAKDNFTLSGSKYECITNNYTAILNEIYDTYYNESHEKNGHYEIFKTEGDLLLIWQPLKEKKISTLEQFSNRSNVRRKRDLETKNEVVYLHLQFLYDTLRDYINTALGKLAEAWCLDQKRTISMLHELSKISPSGIISAVYGKPMSAKLIGDVLAVSKCIEVNQTSVQLHKSMKVKKSEARFSAQMCYSRPLVSFAFTNSSKDTFLGQLGLDNEILLGHHRTEECEQSSTKVFLSGKYAHIFKDYMYVNSSLIDEIEALDAFIELSIEPLENADFTLLELYSKEELSRANVFDLETILREYNSYKSALHNIETKITSVTPAYIGGIDTFFKGLGAVGLGLGAVLGVTAGVLGDVVNGVFSFLKNPFGGTFTILLILGIVAIVVVLFLRYRRLSQTPIEILFPYTKRSTDSVVETSLQTTNVFKDDVLYNKTKEGLLHNDDISSANEYSQVEALNMLKAIKSLDESYKKSEVEQRSKKDKPSLLDRIKYRGYNKITTEEI